MAVDILKGDVREQLARLPSEHFDCVVTSPPYWGLRDYGVEGQIGLEPTLGEHLAAMVEVFRGVRRVLKPSGTLWLNYGDCYATSPNGRSAAATKEAGNDDRTFRDKPFSTIGPIYPAPTSHPFPSEVGRRGGGNAPAGPVYDPGYATPRGSFISRGKQSHHDHGGRVVAGGYLKPKDLCMVANRLAIALQDDGWFVRSEIVWHKLNPMPESARDRPTSAHEKVWLLTKSERYFYDLDAVKEEAKDKGRLNGRDGRNEDDRARPPGSSPRTLKRLDYSQIGRNLRNVWPLATRPFPEAHFATFPPELAERCIKAGCPEDGAVLDPFGGAGTTGLVAQRLGRDCTLIELNPDYIEIARRRIDADRLGPVERAARLAEARGMDTADLPLFGRAAE